MDRTYGYDETAIELTERALYGFESDDYAIIEHFDNGDISGYAILLNDHLEKDYVSADDVIEYFENVADEIDSETE